MPLRLRDLDPDSVRMNKTEERFSLYLDLRMLEGAIRRWLFEDVTLRLADKTRYTPDFWVEWTDGSVTMYEVKGFWRDDARVKIKVAAEKFPGIEFVAVMDKKGTWEYEVIPPR